MTIDDKEKVLECLGELKEMVMQIDIDNFENLRAESVTGLTFGDRLRTIRRARKLTQCELAEKSGAITYMIGRYETGKSVPTITTLEWLCKVLGVSSTDLLGF